MQGSDTLSGDKKPRLLAPQHYESAITAAMEGKTEKAIKLFSGIVEKHPDFSPAYTNLGLQYLKNKKYGIAEKTLIKAIVLNSRDAIAYNHIGIIMRIRGDFDEAHSMYLKAIKYNSKYANAHLNLGILLDMYLQKLPDALTHYKNYQTLTKNNDKLVGKWIIDIEHRIKSDNKISS